MTISITWTMLIVVLSVYLLTRYIYFSYLKWTRGCPDAFDPWVSLTESKSDHGWRTGYQQGLMEAKAKRKIKRLKKQKASLSGQIQNTILKHSQAK